jgi:pimeloyl-ACP methyl ester carboxylesterase
MNKNAKKALAATAIAGAALTAASAYFYKFAILKKKNYDNVWTSETRPQPYHKLRDCDKEKVQKGIDFIFESNPEDVSLRSHDGLRLAGHYIAHPNPNGLFIMVHGYRSSPTNDFSGAVLPIYGMGFSLLLIDQRAHGNSQGHFITFGIRERRDCRSWVDWARERFGADTPMLLYGISMGGATVLMAAPDLPENVRGIVADSPYSSPVDIIRKTCRDMGIPAAPAMPFIHASARLFAGFSLSELTAAQAVQNTDIPIMIIHGEDDRFVPCSMSVEIAAANPRIRRYTFPGGGHGISYMKDKARYHRLVEGFSAEVLCPNSKN